VNVINKLSSRGVIANPSLFVILTLSQTKGKNLIILLRVNSVKPCPEQSEGPLEIATGFALATTFLVGLPRLRADLPTPAKAGFAKAGALQRAGTSLRSLQ
jgi:hypothetical protein